MTTTLQTLAIVAFETSPTWITIVVGLATYALLEEWMIARERQSR